MTGGRPQAPALREFKPGRCVRQAWPSCDPRIVPPAASAAHPAAPWRPQPPGLPRGNRRGGCGAGAGQAPRSPASWEHGGTRQGWCRAAAATAGLHPASGPRLQPCWPSCCHTDCGQAQGSVEAAGGAPAVLQAPLHLSQHAAARLRRPPSQAALAHIPSLPRAMCLPGPGGGRSATRAFVGHQLHAAGNCSPTALPACKGTEPALTSQPTSLRRRCRRCRCAAAATASAASQEPATAAGPTRWHSKQASRCAKELRRRRRWHACGECVASGWLLPSGPAGVQCCCYRTSRFAYRTMCCDAAAFIACRGVALFAGMVRMRHSCWFCWT